MTYNSSYIYPTLPYPILFRKPYPFLKKRDRSALQIKRGGTNINLPYKYNILCYIYLYTTPTLFLKT